MHAFSVVFEALRISIGHTVFLASGETVHEDAGNTQLIDTLSAAKLRSMPKICRSTILLKDLIKPTSCQQPFIRGLLLVFFPTTQTSSIAQNYDSRGNSFL